MKHHITILDESFDVDFTITIDRHGSPANTFGLPEDCDPGEACEFHVDLDDVTDATGNSLPVHGWLKELIEEHLNNCSEVAQQAEEVSTESGYDD